MQHERVARCEVVVLHLAMFGNGRVRCSRVAPCDISLVILGKTEPDGNVDANDLVVSRMDRDSVDKVLPACPLWPGKDSGLDSQKRYGSAAEFATVAMARALP